MHAHTHKVHFSFKTFTHNKNIGFVQSEIKLDRE